MSINILNTLETKQFEREVHHEFQEKGNLLRQATRFRSIDGNKTQFPVLGELTASERIVGTDLVTSNQSATAVVVTTTKFQVAQLTDIFLAGEVNFDAKREAAQSVAMAMGRKMDQVILDAFIAATFTKTVAAGSDDLNTTKLIDAAKQLDLDGVPNADRFGIVHVNGIHHLAGEADVKSSDFNTIKTLVEGGIGTYYGFKFLPIGNLGEEDGLGSSTPTATRQNFLFNKMSIGLAVGKDFEVRIDYIAHKAAHQVAGFFSAGSEIIDETGIVEVTTDET